MIRRLTPDDAEELARLLLANREAHEPYVPERGDDFFQAESQRVRLAAAEHLYGIVDEGRLAGAVTLSKCDPRPVPERDPRYWVDDARRGRGLATRAVGAVVELAFGALELHRLEAATLVDNVVSQRVLEKNRFTRIGLAPRYLHIAGAWRDHVLYQRTRDD